MLCHLPVEVFDPAQAPVQQDVNQDNMNSAWFYLGVAQQHRRKVVGGGQRIKSDHGRPNSHGEDFKPHCTLRCVRVVPGFVSNLLSG